MSGLSRLREGSLTQVQEEVQSLMTSCLNPDVAQRPTAVALYKWTTVMGLAEHNVVELMMHRLQSHAQSLEQKVDMRSQDLVMEMKKVDDLLNEMLPR